jgi:hypothetical protein
MFHKKETQNNAVLFESRAINVNTWLADDLIIPDLSTLTPTGSEFIRASRTSSLQKPGITSRPRRHKTPSTSQATLGITSHLNTTSHPSSITSQTSKINVI